MTTNAKLYVTALLVLGLCVLTMNFAHWHLADPVRFSAFFLFACAASIMKVAAPAMAGKMSFNFIFVLIALTDLTLAGNTVGRMRFRGYRMRLAVRMREQRCWRYSSASRIWQSRLPVRTPHCITDFCSAAPIELRIVLATAAFYIANTFPMAGVIALSTQSAVLRVWKQNNLDSAPQYGLGAAMACGFHEMTRHTGWQIALLLLPVAFLLYRTYRLHLARAEDAASTRRIYGESAYAHD